MLAFTGYLHPFRIPCSGIHLNRALRMQTDSAVVLITGAGKRLGAAMAGHLHRKGYRIALHYQHSKAEAEALRDQFNAARPGSAAVFGANLADAGARDGLIPAVIAQFQRLDVLINNASRFEPSPPGQSSDPLWDALFDSNARAPFFLAQAAAPYLRAQHGCIVNMLDIYSERPKPNHSIYNMAKAALRMMTKSLALELAPEVRVNGIAPGAILWPESGASEAQQQAMIEATPLARLGSTADICEAAAFFIESARFSTGQVLDVDGGRLLR
jgi:pteridine reductase